MDLKYVSNEIVTRGSTNKMLERFEIRTSTYGRYSIGYQAIIHWNKLQNDCFTTNSSHISYSKVNKKSNRVSNAPELRQKKTKKETKQNLKHKKNKINN